MNVDALSGRELDAAVAHHVFGLAVELRTNTKTHQQEYVYPANDGGVLLVPRYAYSLAPSLHVQVWLQEQGWLKTAPLINPPPGETARVTYQHTDGRTMEAHGFPEEAVARIAVKVAIALVAGD